MNNLIINSTLPVITSNFDEIKNNLLVELKSYDLIVDEDSIKVAKKMATKLNKISGEIDTIRKSEVSKLSAPIKQFEAKAKELSSLVQESRKKLLSQVKLLEQKEKDRATVLLETELDSAYLKYEIKDEFKTVTVDDLVIISNLNKTGLALKARKAIDERVLAVKKFQDKIDKRLLTLDAICYEGGLKAPLTKENINHFLLIEDDKVYLEKLVSLIQNEISRIQKMQEKEVKMQTKQPLLKSEKTTEYPKEAQSSYSGFKNAVFAKKSSKKRYIVTATFEVDINEELAPKLADILKAKFAKSSEFKTIPSVTVSEIRV